MSSERWQFINEKLDLLSGEMEDYNRAVRNLRIETIRNLRLEMADGLKEQIENLIYHLSDFNITDRETVIENILSLIRGDNED